MVGESTPSVGDQKSEDAKRTERRALWTVLLLNLALAIAFFIAGYYADSSALIANGLDNGSDGLVYAISLLALSRSDKWKEAAAAVSGVLLLLFAAGVLYDVWRRYVEGSDPVGITMIAMSIGAAAINYYCLRVLQRLEKPDVNMRAATTFSFNDFVSNGGIVLAGAIVLWTGSNWPDLLAGFATALIAIKGGVEILRDARKTARSRAAGERRAGRPARHVRQPPDFFP